MIHCVKTLILGVISEEVLQIECYLTLLDGLTNYFFILDSVGRLVKLGRAIEPEMAIVCASKVSGRPPFKISIKITNRTYWIFLWTS
jgi:hypothetical protein